MVRLKRALLKTIPKLLVVLALLLVVVGVLDMLTSETTAVEVLHTTTHRPVVRRPTLVRYNGTSAISPNKKKPQSDHTSVRSEPSSLLKHNKAYDPGQGENRRRLNQEDDTDNEIDVLLRLEDTHHERKEDNLAASINHSRRYQQKAPNGYAARLHNVSSSVKDSLNGRGGKIERFIFALQEARLRQAEHKAGQQPVISAAIGKHHVHGSVWKDNTTYNLGFWDVMNRTFVEEHVPRPMIGSYQCRNALCSEFLGQDDWQRVSKCVNSLRKKYPEKTVRVGATLKPTCHFVNGTSKGSVVLISFPGSGNSWLRALLERTTGMCTGSLYCDDSIWLSGSVGEGIRSSNVLVVKSHNYDREWAKQFANDTNWHQAAILIIRNPFDAIVSFYKWSLYHAGFTKSGINAHLSKINPFMFGQQPLWSRYINEKRRGWAKSILRVVLHSHERPVLVLHYEDIKRNRTKQVMRVLDFLGVSYSPHSVEQRLQEDVTTFQRNGYSEITDPYTPEQRKMITDMVERTIIELRRGNDGDLLGLDKYLDLG